MDLLLVLGGIFLLLIGGSLKGIPILYPLLLGLTAVIGLALRRGFTPAELTAMVWGGIRKPWRIYEITLLVGACTSLWIASGTVPYFIRHGVALIDPRLFVLSVFLICALLALSIGSAFGVIGILGVVFMVMGRAGGADPAVVAGALLAAAYFCERSTPLSSCANLVAVLSGSDLYGYLRRVFLGSLVPFLATVAFYFVLSLRHPLAADFRPLFSALESLFTLNWPVALPALAVLACILLRLDVRLTLLGGALTAAAVALAVQGAAPTEVLQVAFTGFTAPEGSPLTAVLKSSGMLGMLRPILVIAVAAAYSGIFEGTAMLTPLQGPVDRVARRFGRYAALLVTSVLGASFGCSQTFAVITGHQFLAPRYGTDPEERTALARDLGDSAVIVAPLIPWNVAFTVPAALLGVGVELLPYAAFLYLVPVWRLWRR